jgi:uncharacterized protein
MDTSLLFLCAAAFLAGFIDSIVGGGGLVQIPAVFVLFPHLSVQQALGTSRLAAVVGTSVAAWNYARSVRIPWVAVLCAGVGAGVFSYIGVVLQARMPPDIFKPILLVFIVGIAWLTYSNKQLGQDERLRVSPERLPWAMAGVGAALGFYNGFIGPGTGSLLVFAFVGVIGYAFLRASAAAKVVNVFSDVTSLAYFFFNGHILLHIALPMMICNASGSYVGSRMAMLRGNAFVRKVFIVVLVGVLLRFAWDVFSLSDFVIE